MLLNPTCWLFKLRHMMWHKQRLAKVYEFNPMGADRVQVFFSKREAVSSSSHPPPPFDLWHFSHHVNGRKEVQDMKQITGWAEAPALQWRCLFSLSLLLEEMVPSPETDLPCSFVTQVTGTLLADTCQRRLRRSQWERWRPDCENFDATRLQEVPPNNHINGRQWA